MWSVKVTYEYIHTKYIHTQTKANLHTYRVQTDLAGDRRHERMLFVVQVLEYFLPEPANVSAEPVQQSPTRSLVTVVWRHERVN